MGLDRRSRIGHTGGCMAQAKKSVDIFSLLGWISGCMLAAGLLLAGYVFTPVIQTEIRYRTTRPQTTIQPVDSTLGIVIPKIGANARIISSVDPYDSAIYQQALTKGVAHAAGTVLPGDIGSSFLFSHSSANLLEARTYNSVFYLLSKLSNGDDILIYRNGKEIRYTVQEKKLVEATDTSYLHRTIDYPEIVLMTCWPAGTDLKRLIIVATIAR